ncbi:MAG: DUF4333 domain-containing protein [Solirubrobacterales bacterium]
MRFAIGLVVVIALLALAGCTETLNTDKLESDIEKALTKAGTPAESVDCPSDVEPDKGSRFECTVETKNGKQRKVVVTQLDNEGHVRFRLSR